MAAVMRPHLKAEHMAAPTNAAHVKKVLANSEPSTHGTERTCRTVSRMSLLGQSGHPRVGSSWLMTDAGCR
jgi:hypothetical protein